MKHYELALETVGSIVASIEYLEAYNACSSSDQDLIKLRTSILNKVEATGARIDQLDAVTEYMIAQRGLDPVSYLACLVRKELDASPLLPLPRYVDPAQVPLL